MAPHLRDTRGERFDDISRHGSSLLEFLARGVSQVRHILASVSPLS
jgi:hypothetical protein